MRFVIYGAGAVGGAIGGRLFQSGHDVSLIARGDHLAALQSDGLRLQWADGDETLPVPAVANPSDIELTNDDVVFLCMKTQDTAGALAALHDSAPPGVAIVSAQNGVESERLALRHFANVYAMVVMLPATHLEPGHVIISSAPLTGILDIGRYPTGSDGRAEEISKTLAASTFSSAVDERVMRQKHAKLLMNLGNALQAACGSGAEAGDIYRRLREEATACYEAAGIDWATDDEVRERRSGNRTLQPVAGQGRQGSSTWQSLARGQGSVEADYLNGEIVLLGRLHGVPTPANETVRRLANSLAAEGRPPGTVPVEDVRRLIDEAGSSQAAG
ncbi:MAG: 2-dehydropantoate 2-reductase [Dehalococcoidia bacterium]